MYGIDENDIDVAVSADTDGFTGGMDEAIEALYGVKGASAVAATAIGGLSVAMGVKAVQAAADYQQSMVGVEKVTSPETAREMRTEILAMAETMPIAQEKLAAVAEQAGRLGVEGSENIREFTEVTTKMGVATNLSATEAADGFARMATLMDLSIEDVDKLGSAINALSNNMATSSSEIQDAALRSSGALSQLGLNSQEILALSATMNEASESAQRAGSRLRRLAQELQNPKKVKELAAAFGMTSDEFRQLVRNNPSRAIRMMAQAMGEGGRRADKLNQILGTESRTALSAVSQNMEGLEDATRMANGEFENAQSLNKEYQKASETFNNELQITKNRLNNIAITTGEALLPAFTTLLEGVNEGLKVIGDLNEETDGFVSTAMLTAGTLTGVAGAISLVGSSSAAALPSVVSLGGAITALTGPVGIAIAAASLLAGAWAANLWDMREKTKETTDFIRKEFGEMQDDLASSDGFFGTGIQLWPDKEHTPDWWQDSGLPTHDEANDGDDQPGFDEEQGREDAESYNSEYMSRLKELQNQSSPADWMPDDSQWQSQGESAASAFQTGVQAKLSEDTAIKSWTPAIRETLKDGVEGYKSEDLEPVPTEITPELFQAMAENGGVSPEKLGVTETEFGVLAQRAGYQDFGRDVLSSKDGNGSTAQEPRLDELLGSNFGETPRSVSGPRSGRGSGASGVQTPSVSQLGQHVSRFASAVEQFERAVEQGMTVVVQTTGDWDEMVDARIESERERSRREYGAATGRTVTRT
jgi:TP901 family phage tail tape measure protein